jgi:hypothetical protein
MPGDLVTLSTDGTRVLRAMHQLRRLGTDHQFGQGSIGFMRRIADAGDFASAQNGASVAQLTDLVQLVADVQDAAALGRQLVSAPRTTFSTACGVSTDVGSSRISNCGLVSSARMISTRCISPTLRVWTGRCGSISRPYSVALSVMACVTSARLKRFCSNPARRFPPRSACQRD